MSNKEVDKKGHTNIPALVISAFSVFSFMCGVTSIVFYVLLLSLSGISEISLSANILMVIISVFGVVGIAFYLQLSYNYFANKYKSKGDK